MIENIWQLPNQEFNEVDFGVELYPQIQHILMSRGITTKEQFQKLVQHRFDDLYDPFLMKDMDVAVDRLGKALDEHQRILVYGDYDVDGTTAIALVYSFLKDRNADVDFYVPDRYSEGYGVSEKGIREAIEHNVQLIITLDCGIKALSTIAMAQSAGIDVIVCDHHNQGQKLPDAYAVLDPKRHDCEYPFKELSGCGVGYKLLSAFCRKYGVSEKENLNCYLDYLAISTAADIVPIVGENRVYMYYGLMKMIQKPLVPIKTMLAYSKLIFLYKNGDGEEQIICPNGSLTVSDIVFKIAPKINAAGRMKNARDAIHLLLAKDETEALQYFATVVEQNSERQKEEKRICEEAFAMIEENSAAQSLYSTVLYRESWHKGVVGIAAAKVIEQYFKPTVILCGDGDVISGSARSVGDFDLYSAIEKCSSSLTAFGGHRHAAGLSLKKANLETFKQQFEEAVKSTITPSQQRPTIYVDEVLTLAEVTNELYNQIQYMAPFGPDNMDPVFVIRNLVPDTIYIMGNDNNHVKLSFKQNESSYISAVGFGMAEKWRSLPPKASIDICFTIGLNVFRGNVSLQLQLKDFRESGK